MASLPQLFDLTGRTAVVTGGAGALGTAISVALAEAGAAVAVVDLRIENATRVADSINATGGRAVGYSGDLSKAAGVAEVFGSIDAEFGRIDILVNAISAPVNRFQPEEFPLDEWQTMLDSNLTSYFLCAQAAGHIMMRGERGGSIVNFGSIAGVSALGRGNLAYAVAKGGVMQFTRELAYAWADRNIRVNTILPCQFRQPDVVGSTCRPGTHAGRREGTFRHSTWSDGRSERDRRACVVPRQRRLIDGDRCCIARRRRQPRDESWRQPRVVERQPRVVERQPRVVERQPRVVARR